VLFLLVVVVLLHCIFSWIAARKRGLPEEEEEEEGARLPFPSSFPTSTCELLCSPE
jgi:hypothetical protein